MQLGRECERRELDRLLILRGNAKFVRQGQAQTSGQERLQAPIKCALRTPPPLATSVVISVRIGTCRRLTDDRDRREFGECRENVLRRNRRFSAICRSAKAEPKSSRQALRGGLR